MVHAHTSAHIVKDLSPQKKGHPLLGHIICFSDWTEKKSDPKKRHVNQLATLAMDRILEISSLS